MFASSWFLSQAWRQRGVKVESSSGQTFSANIDLRSSQVKSKQNGHHLAPDIRALIIVEQTFYAGP
jgi:hypothetical protein